MVCCDCYILHVLVLYNSTVPLRAHVVLYFISTSKHEQYRNRNIHNYRSSGVRDKINLKDGEIKQPFTRKHLDIRRKKEKQLPVTASPTHQKNGSA